MPKVTQEYIDQKKKLIVEAAAKLCDKKTVCSVTMQDIIDETGLSQGGIYRFYQNIDDILIDVFKLTSSFTFFNNENSLPALLEKLELARNSKKSDAAKIKERKFCVYELIQNICTNLSLILEKYQHPFFAIQHGFSNLILNYPERAKYILSQIEYPFSMKKEINILIKELKKEINDGALTPRVSPEEFISFLQTSFSGINQDILVSERLIKNIKNQKSYSANISKRFKLVEASCFYLLGLEEFEK